MPALQVRDFPDDLYEELKVYAASQHRSIAQQTIVAVEQMLQAEATGAPFSAEHKPHYLAFDTEAERAARIKRKKEVFERIGQLHWNGPKPTAEEIVAVVREGHKERDEAILQSLGFYDEIEGRRAAEA